jgi:hypothetical protein
VAAQGQKRGPSATAPRRLTTDPCNKVIWSLTAANGLPPIMTKKDAPEEAVSVIQRLMCA